MNKAVTKVLDQIQQKANKKFGKKLFKKVDRSEILFVFDKMLEKELPPWKRRYYEAMRKEFDKEEEKVDEEVSKAMDKYVEDEISKAIKAGKLPKPKKYENT